MSKLIIAAIAFAISSSAFATGPYSAQYHIGVKPAASVTLATGEVIVVEDKYYDIFANGTGQTQAEADSTALANCNLYNTITFTSDTPANSSTYWTISSGLGPMAAVLQEARKIHGKRGNLTIAISVDKGLPSPCHKVQ